MDLKKLYIDGQWVAPLSGQYIDVENPATKETFATVAAAGEQDVAAAALAAAKAFPAWAARPMEERIDFMRKLLKELIQFEPQMVDAVVNELGIPVSFVKTNHIGYQFVRTQSYIDLAPKLPLVEKLPQSVVYRRPLGVIGCITPWNYPLGQIIQKVIPAILVGATVVLKPSQSTPLTACLMMEAFRLADFPKGVVNLVSGRGSRAGAELALNPKVAMISFTGSTAVGVSLSQQALKTVKRISLELGGKSPCVWLPDLPDYRAAVKPLFNSIFLNSGQTCTALSRLIVPKTRLAEVEKLLLDHVKDYPVGDPFDPKVLIGPMASRQQFETVKSYIELGVKEGALLLAGSIPEEPGAHEKGWFIQPTIFTDVKNDMRIAREEIFGPVLCVIAYDTVDEAVAIANDTPYGLNAMVVGPKAEAQAVARRINAGNVYINDAPRDVTAPFGGYGASGIGREGGRYGLMEFTQLKAVFDHSTY